MKNFFKTMGWCTAMGVAFNAGYWLWENVLEEKAEDLVDYLKSKSNRKEEN